MQFVASIVLNTIESSPQKRILLIITTIPNDTHIEHIETDILKKGYIMKIKTFVLTLLVSTLPILASAGDKDITVNLGDGKK